MNEIVSSEKINIENMIYEVRGMQVMLSSDVAGIYQVETKRVNEVIKRNINRFPATFCFQLTGEEIKALSLRSQFATLNKSNNLRGRHYKYLPYVLTEQGIMMLSGLLKSDIAVRVNIQIIDAFVKMRKYFANNISNTDILISHENRLLELEKAWDKFKEKELNRILFKGQLYDSYSVLLDIFEEPKEEITIIDNYMSKELLDVLTNINKKIIVVSKYSNEKLKNKYEKQYNNVRFVKTDAFHDRFIIIDRKKFYHCGASFKDLGKKCFGIHEMSNMEWLNQLLKIVDENL